MSSFAVIPESRTPASVMLLCVDSGMSEPPIDISRTDLLLALEAGPLKSFLASQSDWSLFNNIGAGDRVRLTNVVGGRFTFVVPRFNQYIVWVANALRLVLTNTGATFFTELRFVSSVER